jgi:hypothetical protein
LDCHLPVVVSLVVGSFPVDFLNKNGFVVMVNTNINDLVADSKKAVAEHAVLQRVVNDSAVDGLT